MPLENIVEKIIKDAKDEAKKIISEAREKAQDVIQKAEKKAQREESARIDKAKKVAEEGFNREITLFNLEARKRILKIKCDVIDEVFEKVLDKINALDEKSFRKIIAKFMPKTQFAPNSEIIVLSRDKEKVVLCLSNILGNEVVVNWKVVEADNEEMKGGFFIKSGEFVYDLSLKTLIQQVKSKYENKVAEILFGQDEQ